MNYIRVYTEFKKKHTHTLRRRECNGPKKNEVKLYGEDDYTLFSGVYHGW